MVFIGLGLFGVWAPLGFEFFLWGLGSSGLQVTEVLVLSLGSGFGVIGVSVPTRCHRWFGLLGVWAPLGTELFLWGCWRLDLGFIGLGLFGVWGHWDLSSFFGAWGLQGFRSPRFCSFFGVWIWGHWGLSSFFEVWGCWKLDLGFMGLGLASLGFGLLWGLNAFFGVWGWIWALWGLDSLGSLGFQLFLWGLGSSGLQITEVLLFLWGLDLGSLGSQSPHGATVGLDSLGFGIGIVGVWTPLGFELFLWGLGLDLVFIGLGLFGVIGI